MDKRYQVFVSSTYEDLREERHAVMQALLALDCIPTGMELFPAADNDSWTHIKRFIEGCDYYVVIVGGRYGSIGVDGRSYTEMEYDYAVKAGVPALAFMHREPGIIPASKTESTDVGKSSLAAFRKKIEDARHAKYWVSASELAGTVTVSMVSIMKIKPRVGWVRADLVPDESAAQQMLKLRRKIEDLETQIAESGSNPPAGSETLAKGEETIKIHYSCTIAGYYQESRDTFSWNMLLSILGPLLIVQATEEELREKLSEAIANRQKDDGVAISRIYPRDEDFQRIKLQFRALGIIREVVTLGVPMGWALTPYGDRLMTQVAAIRSSVSPG